MPLLFRINTLASEEEISWYLQLSNSLANMAKCQHSVTQAKDYKSVNCTGLSTSL